MSADATPQTRRAKPAKGLRFSPGVLRTPPFGRSPVRISETAFPIKPGASLSWIERALIDMPDIDMPDDVEDADPITTGLIANLLRARVGGTFWGKGPAWATSIDTVVKVDHSSQLRPHLSLALSLAKPDRVGVVMPAKYWSAAAARKLTDRGVAWSIGDVDPWAILDQAKSVIVGGDDELGFLALLAGLTVHCCSSGYLSGWGLTQDAASIEARGRREIWQVAAAALTVGVRYFDPYSQRVTDCETVVERLADWRRTIDEDRDLACSAGIALWKRSRFRKFLAPHARGAPMLSDAQKCVALAKASGGAIAVWPSRTPTGLTSLAHAENIDLRQIEDGFLRSVGLGSDLLLPCSIVIDRRGIYYDPHRPSNLEAILTESEFSTDLCARALRLADMLVTRGLTKYNTGGRGFVRPARSRVVLVPGQVEDDQSWRLGGAECSGNLDLLRRVRLREPDAFIIYKPHPDVEAGNRIGAVSDSDALKFADQIVREVAMPALLDAVDAVHVLTSLTGFEALLRNREVVTHGQPFYSGWGLTHDLTPPPRRGRPLTMAMLVAGTLILYPRYLDPVTELLCPPEVLVERLAGRRQGVMAGVLAIRRLRRSIEGMFRLTAKLSSLRAQVVHD